MAPELRPGASVWVTWPDGRQLRAITRSVELPPVGGLRVTAELLSGDAAVTVPREYVTPRRPAHRARTRWAFWRTP